MSHTQGICTRLIFSSTPQLIRVCCLYRDHVHCCFEDVRVNLGHTVDGVGAHDAQVSHVDPLLAALFNQGHAGHALIISRELGCDSLQNCIFLLKQQKCRFTCRILSSQQRMQLKFSSNVFKSRNSAPSGGSKSSWLQCAVPTSRWRRLIS